MSNIRRPSAGEASDLGCLLAVAVILSVFIVAIVVLFLVNNFNRKVKKKAQKLLYRNDLRVACRHDIFIIIIAVSFRHDDYQLIIRVIFQQTRTFSYICITPPSISGR